MIRAGRLNHRIEIQELDGATTDAAGHPGGTWRKKFSRWASVEPLSGRELFTARQVVTDVTHKVTIHGGGLDPADLSTKRRVLHRGRVLHITHVVNRQERGIEIELYCIEAAA